MNPSGLNFTLPQLLKSLLDQKGSDLHITAESAPRLRINGQLLPLDVPSLTESQAMQLCYSVLSEEQKKRFEMDQELDVAFTVKGLCRFRANIFLQKAHVGGVFRVISNQLLSIKDLGLPQVIQDLCHQPRGLILVTGPTGSGKSTTLAAMIDYINTNMPYHIVTIEDPIEFVHQNKKSIINQREVGSDTKSFSKALKSSLRQDPNVVLVGELRDFETISMALTAAETGHLVFATLHTNTAIASINRLIDVFPPEQQTQIRTQISFSLVAVVTQILVPSLAGGRLLCSETMILNSAIRNLIREDKIHQIYSVMQIGQEESKMKTMNQSLLDLILKKKISPEIAITKSPDSLELIDLIQKTPGAGYFFKKL